LFPFFVPLADSVEATTSLTQGDIQATSEKEEDKKKAKRSLVIRNIFEDAYNFNTPGY